MFLPIAAAIAALVAGAAGVYHAGAPKRAARRVREERRRTRREIRATEEILAYRERALAESARRYAEEQVRERLRDVPLDVLRGQLGKRVKIAPLEQAGYATVADLVGKPRAELRAVKGVGPLSARAIELAVANYLRTAQTTAPPLPAAELDEPGAVDLARDTLVYLEAWRELDGVPESLRAAFRDLEERARAEMRRVNFARWVTRRLPPDQAERLLALAEEMRAARAAPPFDAAMEARRRLERSRTSALGADEVRASFRRDYADGCAILERVLADLGLALERERKPRAAPAPLEEEIARRVETFPLETRGLKVILRRYQAFGARYLLALERTVLGDEMGLGKTIQALAAAVHLANERPEACALVVAPASILGNWMHEIGQRTPLKAHLLHGDDSTDALARWATDGGVAVTSYTTLRLRAEDFARAGPARLALLVADEAHYVKNPAAGRTRALVRVAGRADRVCFMSGTPLENHPEEFVRLLETLAPARARDLSEFLRQPGSVLGGARRFHKELADVDLRRNQEDVLKELPERIDKDEWLDLGAPERAAYGEQVQAGNFMGMRRAVTVSAEEPPGAKFERLVDLLEEYRESGVKVLLFSYFLDVLKEVARRFAPLGIITGDVAPQKRFDMARAFQEADGHRLLAAQIDAGGTGLNLQAAGAVVLMEPQLKPTTEAQAVARAHRMGQTRRVVVHRLLARDSVDERLVELLAEKQDLFERFARESLIKEASEEATAASPARTIIEAERQRLGSA